MLVLFLFIYVRIPQKLEWVNKEEEKHSYLKGKTTVFRKSKNSLISFSLFPLLDSDKHTRAREIYLHYIFLCNILATNDPLNYRIKFEKHSDIKKNFQSSGSSA